MKAKGRELSTMIHDYSTKITANSSKLSALSSEITLQEKGLENSRKEHWLAEQAVVIAQPAFQSSQSLRTLTDSADTSIDLDTIDGFRDMISSAAKFSDALQANVTALKGRIIQSESKITASKQQVAALQKEQIEVLGELQAFRPLLYLSESIHV